MLGAFVHAICPLGKHVSNVAQQAALQLLAAAILEGKKD
jgi:hypothetical protein